jgi:hypothetical protein
MHGVSNNRVYSLKDENMLRPVCFSVSLSSKLWSSNFTIKILQFLSLSGSVVHIPVGTRYEVDGIMFFNLPLEMLEFYL